MPLGSNYNPAGKGSDFTFQFKVLQMIAGVNAALTTSPGLATEATLQTVLAELKDDKDYEINLIKDTGNADQIIKEVISYSQDTGAKTITYEDASGAAYTPIGPLAYIDTETAIQAVITELQTLVLNFAGQTRTPSISRVTASGTIAAGARSVSFFNSGASDTTVLGTILKAGEAITFNGGGENDTLSAITYDPLVSELLIISIV